MPRHHTPPDWLGRLIPPAIEAIVLVMVAASPWVFGAVTPGFLSWLYFALAAVLLLWAARALLDPHWTWDGDGVSWCLGGIFLIGVAQTLPLPAGLIEWLSPHKAELARSLLPAEPEQLPDNEPALAVPAAAALTLSVQPNGSRMEAVKLLAVFLLFAAVRQNCVSAAALGRLALLCCVNGSLLSLFGLAQFFSSPSHVIFWTFPSDGAVFGPFVCRNHFPFYVNVCIGLTVGLLLTHWRLQAARSDRQSWETTDAAWWRAPFRLLHDPPALWLSVALALMATAVLFSLSRGGVLSLLGSAVACLVFKLAQARQVSRLEGFGMTLLLVTALAAWLGFDPVRDRLAIVWQGAVLEDGRVDTWRRGLHMVADFPLVGSGLGSWWIVEPLYRSAGDSYAIISNNAHNDYLEALAEGGVGRLLLSVLAIGLVYRHAWANLRRRRNRYAGGLLLGALFGFTAIVLHSFVDFGLHIPAIAVLATLVAAHLTGQPRFRRRRRRRSRPGADPVEAKPAIGDAPDRAAKRRRWLPAAAALTFTLLAWMLWSESNMLARSEGYRLTAAALAEPDSPTAVERQLEYLGAAVRLAPGNPHLHVEVAEALLALHRRVRRAPDPDGQALAAGTLVLAGAQASAGWVAAVGQVAPGIIAAVPPDSEHDGRFLVPALAHCLAARDLCPLLPEAQLWLAARRDHFAHADSRTVYLQRATILSPAHPEVWYLLGDAYLRDGARRSAWASWQQSLRASEKFMPAILARCRAELSADEIIRDVLPADPERLLAAATHLYPQPAQQAQRQPYLERALALLREPGGGLRPAEQRLTGRLLASMQRPAEAVDAYTAAVLQAPDKPRWRFELAELLYQQGKLIDARDQLLLVLALQPSNGEARALLDAVRRELAGVR